LGAAYFLEDLWHGRVALRPGDRAPRPGCQDSSFGGWNSLPVTAVAAALTSLDDATVVPERNGSMLRSQRNFRVACQQRLQLRAVGFELLHAGRQRPAKEIIEAMAARNVFIGRAWPVWPTHVRIPLAQNWRWKSFKRRFRM